MASSCGAPGGCGFAYAIVHCGGAVHFGVRSLRGSWGAWLPLPWVAVPTLDTRFIRAFGRAFFVIDKDVFLWRLLVGPLGVVASRT